MKSSANAPSNPGPAPGCWRFRPCGGSRAEGPSRKDCVPGVSASPLSPRMKMNWRTCNRASHAPWGGIDMHLLVIAGPTASGKTAIGAAVAHALGVPVLSADSRQVYRGLDLGTGKDLEEFRKYDPFVPYHLIDIADPQEVYTLFQYQSD